MRLMLDTNAYSEMVRGHREVLGRVRDAEKVLLSVIVIGELMRGFRRGTRFEENNARLERFLRRPLVEVVPVTLTTADRFARLSAMLLDRGRVIPLNDLWIAAQVMETGADLLSANLHFAEIEGLAWIPFSLDEEDTIRERVLRYDAEAAS